MMLNSQEWTRILMPSKQEWRWTVTMSPKSLLRLMASGNKIQARRLLRDQASSYPLHQQLRHAPSLKKGMSARNARNRKQPEKYVPSMQGNEYAAALTQIVASLKGSKHAMSMAQMSVKLMSKGAHRKAEWWA
jgi:hypothetical protein